MWSCPKCKRIFAKTAQPHSCKTLALAEHFKNKSLARDIFDFLVKEIEAKAGKCKIVSIPCCVHLFGAYDFLAALPKKDRLEIRFALNRKLATPRLKVSLPLSAKSFKNCFDLRTKKEINAEILGWITESYHLKD